MKIGLQVVRFNWPGNPQNTAETLAEIVKLADAGGFSSLWVMDHFYQLDPHIGSASDPMLEAYSLLNYFAGITKKVRLGTLVTGVIYRHPALLVKTLTTLDILSGGRANFGIGAAWYERETHGLGFDFPPLKERFDRLEEALQIANHLWSGNTEPYTGKYHQLNEPISSPQPLSKPHPPILIGGGGEKKTLRLVAQYADACNFFSRIGREELLHKLDVLKSHCNDVGRDFSEIEVTALSSTRLRPGEQTAKDIINQCREMAAIGVEHMIFNMPNYHEITPIETFVNEIIPAVSGL